MSVRRETVELTGPAGTVVSPRPISGEILEIRLNSTNLSTSPAGSADFTLTRVDDGGTILAVSNTSPPFSYSPRQIIHTVTGGTLTQEATSAAAGAQVEGIPVDGHVRVVTAQAGTATDTLHILYRA